MWTASGGGTRRWWWGSGSWSWAGPGTCRGVVGKKPIHLLKPEDRKKVTQIRDLWVDLGASSAEEVGEMGVRVGDPLVLDAEIIQLAGDRIASRAIDDRVGAYVVLEALRLLAAEPPESAGAVAVATVQEEIGYTGGGARSSAFALDPDVALVVDVTFATDVPDANKKELGEHSLGGGPVLTRGSSTHPVVFEHLADAAAEEEIPYTIQAAPKASRTDAERHLSRPGRRPPRASSRSPTGTCTHRTRSCRSSISRERPA